MASTKRGDFEEQLRALQQDIGQLSHKLSIPLLKDELNDHKRDIVKESVGSDTSGNPKGEMVRLKKDIRQLTRERDDALYRLDQLKRENEELRKSSGEVLRVKALCESLQQDNESLKTSLESSEKLRKQQKELIQLLQTSHAAVDGSNKTPHNVGIPLNISAPSSISSSTRWLHDTAVHPPSPVEPPTQRGSTSRNASSTGKAKKSASAAKSQMPSRHTSRGKSGTAKKTRVRARQTHVEHQHHQQHLSSSSYDYPHHNSYRHQAVPPEHGEDNRSYHSTASIHSAPADMPNYPGMSAYSTIAASPLDMGGRPPRPPTMPRHAASPNGVRFSSTPSPLSSSATRPRPHSAPHSRPRPRSSTTTSPSSRSSTAQRIPSSSVHTGNTPRSATSTPTSVGRSSRGGRGLPTSSPAGRMTIRTQPKSAAASSPALNGSGNRGTFGRTTW